MLAVGGLLKHAPAGGWTQETHAPEFASQRGPQVLPVGPKQFPRTTSYCQGLCVLLFLRRCNNESPPFRTVCILYGVELVAYRAAPPLGFELNVSHQVC